MSRVTRIAPWFLWGFFLLLNILPQFSWFITMVSWPSPSSVGAYKVGAQNFASSQCPCRLLEWEIISYLNSKNKRNISPHQHRRPFLTTRWVINCTLEKECPAASTGKQIMPLWRQRKCAVSKRCKTSRHKQRTRTRMTTILVRLSGPTLESAL